MSLIRCNGNLSRKTGTRTTFIGTLFCLCLLFHKPLSDYRFRLSQTTVWQHAADAVLRAAPLTHGRVSIPIAALHTGIKSYPLGVTHNNQTGT